MEEKGCMEECIVDGRNVYIVLGLYRWWTEENRVRVEYAKSRMEGRNENLECGRLD